MTTTEPVNTVTVYRGRPGMLRRQRWRWHFQAPNGKKLAGSLESYANREDALDALSHVLGVAPTSLVSAGMLKREGFSSVRVRRYEQKRALRVVVM